MSEENMVQGIQESLYDVDEKPKGKIVRYLTLVDEDTGRVQTSIRLPNKGLGYGWIAIYQTALLILAKLRFDEKTRVLFYLLAKLDYGNYLAVQRKEIADYLEIDPTRVSRAMRELKRLGILLEYPRTGMTKSYIINPEMVYKGTDRKGALCDFDEMRSGLFNKK